MKKLQKFLQEAFSFTQNEARGSLLLLLLLIVFVVLMNISDVIFVGSPPEITIEQIQKLDSSITILDKRTNTKYYASSKKTSTKKFPFDPNTSSVPTLISLGFPPYLAERIEKYRNKGGKFKKAEDLQKIYGFPPSLWNELAPFMQFNASSTSVNSSYQQNQTFNSTQKNQTNLTSNEQQVAAVIERPNSKSKTIRFDLNTADTTQLKLLPGIGSGYAKRIIAFREKLGGFLHVEQVSETYQLSELAVQSITEQCIIQKEIRKISINKIDKITHPYLTYAQANSLISYRKQHGFYKSEQDLRAVKTLDENTIQRILPYLSFD